MHQGGSIGIFDSGYGGLTVFRSIAAEMPQYDFIYLGDNARSPYGDYTFETVYQYTWQCVKWLFDQGCRLVILACNTASAKALRSIQQNELPRLYPTHRVLGVIRPTAESIGEMSETQKIGVLGTRGTVASNSYPIEIAHFFPDAMVYQQACPMWVPLIENNEQDNPGADYFVEKYVTELITQDPQIDTILLACTHYPLLLKKIQAVTPAGTQLVLQADVVANRLKDYLLRHQEIDGCLQKSSELQFFTTGDIERFNTLGSQFFGKEIKANKISVS